MPSTTSASLTQSLKQFDSARESFVKAINLDPTYADAHFNLGNALASQSQHREAVECFKRAIALKPGFAKALQNRGASQEQLGELDAAEESYRRALESDPEYRSVQTNLGLVMAVCGRREGIRILEEILERDPGSADAHWNLSVALLTQGDYLRAWPEFEWRWESGRFTSPKRGFPQPQWRGGPLNGKTILLHAEQGFGDTLQFARYAPLVAARGGRVVLEVQPALRRLLSRVPGVSECIAVGQPLPDFECHCPLMSLPLAFSTTLETIPPAVFAGNTPSSSSSSENVGDLKVGLVWAGNPGHRLDALRSIPFSQYLPLAAIEGITFASLQLGEAARQAEIWPDSLAEPLKNVTDFADSAEIVSGFDLVITIDSAVAHLAGSFGKPVWILQAPVPDWRWGLQSETTPWYPSARLFRRAASGTWDAVIVRIATELVRLSS